MARKGIRYLVARINQIAVLTAGSLLFLALCFISISQAKNERGPVIEQPGAASPAEVMQALLSPSGNKNSPACLIPVAIPATERCDIFFNLDDEEVLENLVHNYTSCLDDERNFLDLSNQKPVVINKTLNIYGRTDKKPLTIRGLNLRPSKDFPKDMPAIAVFGKKVRLEDAQLKGFSIGAVFVSENVQHEMIGGKIEGRNGAKNAIIACAGAPEIEGTKFSGFSEDVAVIAQ